MCLTTVRADRGQLASTGAFLKRRFVRIFPMYWALTALALVIYLIAPRQVNMAGGETKIVESFFLESLPGCRWPGPAGPDQIALHRRRPIHHNALETPL